MTFNVLTFTASILLTQTAFAAPKAAAGRAASKESDLSRTLAQLTLLSKENDSRMMKQLGKLLTQATQNRDVNCVELHNAVDGFSGFWTDRWKKIPDGKGGEQSYDPGETMPLASFNTTALNNLKTTCPRGQTKPGSDLAQGIKGFLAEIGPLAAGAACLAAGIAAPVCAGVVAIISEFLPPTGNENIFTNATALDNAKAALGEPGGSAIIGLAAQGTGIKGLIANGRINAGELSKAFCQQIKDSKVKQNEVRIARNLELLSGFVPAQAELLKALDGSDQVSIDFVKDCITTGESDTAKPKFR